MCKVTNQEVEAAGSEVWVNRKGVKVFVKDMSDEYCRAALNALLKKIRERSNRTSSPKPIIAQDMGKLMDEEDAKKVAEMAVLPAVVVDDIRMFSGRACARNFCRENPPYKFKDLGPDAPARWSAILIK